jgi:DNA-binding NarL/FixJ family response regulator
MTDATGFPGLGGLCSDADLGVAVVADRMTRARIAAQLAAEGISVSALASTPGALTDACPRRAPHVAVVAWDACGETPVTTLRQLRHEFVRTRVVVVLGPERREHLLHALDAGVDAVVLASRLATTLGPTIRAVLAGQACVPRELRRRLERPVLSAREKQVLAMVATGFTNGEIAERLFLAESTVKGHLSSAFAKLGVRTRREATALALDAESRLGISLIAVARAPESAVNGGA